VIPVVSTTVPSTLGKTLAPNVPVVIAEAVVGTIATGIAQVGISGLSPDELIKSMEELKLQVT